MPPRETLFHARDVIPRQRRYSTPETLSHARDVIPRQRRYPTPETLFHARDVIPRQRRYPITSLRACHTRSASRCVSNASGNSIACAYVTHSAAVESLAIWSVPPVTRVS